MGDELALTARWIIPVSGPPLEGGIVVVSGDKIRSIEARGSRLTDFDAGNAAIVPGLVNAHTHLDLSGMRGKIPPSADFIGWLKSVVAHRRSQSLEQIESDTRLGLEESLRLGTTLIGDIAAGGLSWSTLSRAKVWSVVFCEILGLPRDRVPQVWRDAVAWKEEEPVTATCRKGWSPHAPYSVNAAILRQAPAAGAPVAIHLAETCAERDLLEERSGPFVPFLKDLGVWDPDGLVPSHEFILRHCRQQAPVIFAHGNYLSPDAKIPRNATIVYCPRTHAAFGHSPHPFREFLQRGVRVALGTDSLASNPDLDLFAEARFIHAHHQDFPGDALLRMATLSGAEALGWADQTGSLAPGKSADLVVMPLADEESDDPYRLLFGPDAGASSTRRTMWRGAWR